MAHHKFSVLKAAVVNITLKYTKCNSYARIYYLIYKEICIYENRKLKYILNHKFEINAINISFSFQNNFRSSFLNSWIRSDILQIWTMLFHFVSWTFKKCQTPLISWGDKKKTPTQKMLQVFILGLINCNHSLLKILESVDNFKYISVTVERCEKKPFSMKVFIILSY